MSLRLSYSQISKLGAFLKTFDQEGRLSSLKEQYFDEEVISNIVKGCFRPFLAEKMYRAGRKVLTCLIEFYILYLIEY